uniref:Transmembrane protein n=1 Tax=Medicago truncatula TaxID=3880 RepID=I3SIH1_MEDTR|nr:unknown [Medicago truncatula]
MHSFTMSSSYSSRIQVTQITMIISLLLCGKIRILVSVICFLI